MSMTHQSYAEYEAAFKRFFENEGIVNLSSASEEPYFSWTVCDCCQRPMGGNCYDATGYNPTTKEVQEYSVCEDCVYYAEYGQLDNKTMMAVEDSKLKPGKRVEVVDVCEDGGDDWAIGEQGVIRQDNGDGYFEVELDGHGPKTFLFGDYQLEGK